MVKLTSLEGKTKLALCFFSFSWTAKMQFAKREKEMGLTFEAMLSGLVALQYVRWLGWPEQDLSKAKGLEWSPALFCLSCDERIIPSSSLQLKEWLFFRKRRRQAFFTQWWTWFFFWNCIYDDGWLHCHCFLTASRAPSDILQIRG